jgi:hypothetical protein
MKKQKIVLSFLIILSLFFIVSSGALAEKRNIYIGDLIQIKVETLEFTQEELREKFKDFEIVEMEGNKDGFVITLRSFEAGEKKVQLGNKEIVIDVKSVLKDKKRVGIYEGDSSVEEGSSSFDIQYVFYVLAGIFVLTGGINLWKLLRKRKPAIKSPYQHFTSQMESISADDGSFLVKLTFYLKEYIESRYSLRIRGKTSSEIIAEISNLKGLAGHLPAIRHWLNQCDLYKFWNTGFNGVKTG